VIRTIQPFRLGPLDFRGYASLHSAVGPIRVMRQCSAHASQFVPPPLFPVSYPCQYHAGPAAHHARVVLARASDTRGRCSQRGGGCGGSRVGAARVAQQKGVLSGVMHNHGVQPSAARTASLDSAAVWRRRA
jgi:hypothetical protein